MILALSLVAIVFSVIALIYSLEARVLLKAIQLKGSNLHFLSVDQLGMDEKSIEDALSLDLE